MDTLDPFDVLIIVDIVSLLVFLAYITWHEFSTFGDSDE